MSRGTEVYINMSEPIEALVPSATSTPGMKHLSESVSQLCVQLTEASNNILDTSATFPYNILASLPCTLCSHSLHI